MLNFLLVLFSIAVWITLYSLYFRKEIKAWVVNRFGKDKPPAQNTPVEPIIYSKAPDTKMDG